MIACELMNNTLSWLFANLGASYCEKVPLASTKVDRFLLASAIHVRTANIINMGGGVSRTARFLDWKDSDSGPTSLEIAGLGTRLPLV